MTSSMSIAAMDADVITIETSRSDMELLEAFDDFDYPNQIGPGVYDIHSPNIPSREQMEQLMLKATQRIPAERLWVNPDCGLKTRQWDEVIPALRNMVASPCQHSTPVSSLPLPLRMGRRRVCGQGNRSVVLQSESGVAMIHRIRPIRSDARGSAGQLSDAPKTTPPEVRRLFFGASSVKSTINEIIDQ